MEKAAKPKYRYSPVNISRDLFCVINMSLDSIEGDSIVGFKLTWIYDILSDENKEILSVVQEFFYEFNSLDEISIGVINEAVNFSLLVFKISAEKIAHSESLPFEESPHGYSQEMANLLIHRLRNPKNLDSEARPEDLKYGQHN